ncbi:MAG TPA: hypothetical protein VE077_14120 [Candidatus Methylomirabilis sp.]|nr:hypothetical protein [Candidatus Methylomirabilis sp.]
MAVKLSFIPADLHLDADQDGQFKVTLQGTEIFRSSSSTKALKKFNEVRKELEEKFPTHDLSVEEKSELLQRSIMDSLVKHNSLKPEEKKSAARSTRTFG